MMSHKANMNCKGCRLEEELLVDCPTRYCAMEKGLDHCGDCESFPCPELKAFYEDGISLHQEAYQNILRIREIGLKEWLDRL